MLPYKNTELRKSQEIKPITKNDFAQISKSGVIEDLNIAIISISLFEGDEIWLEQKLIDCINIDNIIIKKICITGLSHYIRRFKKLIEFKKIKNILTELNLDKQYSGIIEDFWDDYQLYKKS